ncbi:MAG: helix-turn-helix domain-containing protein [Clostridiales bacterium]|nr:helix-turn-helix domain-containing protein [Clostridiales bacterium]
MFEKLLPAIENSMMSDSGSVPVVFEGLEHILEKKVPNAIPSVHKTHELLYCRSGRINYIVEGKTISLEKGNTIILRPNTAHKVEVPRETADTYVLYFGFSKTSDRMYETDRTSLESFLDFASGESVEGEDKPYIILSGNYKNSISSIVERIVEEKKENDISNELMMRVLTVELMVVLSRAMKREWEESLRVRNGKARELVLIARDYIDDNYHRGITVADAASYVFLSQGYFTRAFRDEFGTSPMNYLMKKRIEGACELLENNEIKVSAVAVQAGFSSPQRFNVAFRKQMGMTPIEYRKTKIKGV